MRTRNQNNNTSTSNQPPSQKPAKAAGPAGWNTARTSPGSERKKRETGSKRGTWFVPAVLSGFLIVLLYDKGASVCTIGRGTIKRMGLGHLVYRTTTARCTTANGPCVLDRAIQLEMMMLGATRTTQFMVTLDDNQDNTPLLGAPVSNPSNKVLEGPAWETKASKANPELGTA